MEKYCNGFKTDLEESFHRVALKYWKKGTSYEFESYVIRRALAVLDWNENFGKIQKSRTDYFRKDIMDKFQEFLQKRSKSRLVKNQTYVAKKYGITDYYQ